MPNKYKFKYDDGYGAYVVLDAVNNVVTVFYCPDGSKPKDIREAAEAFAKDSPGYKVVSTGSRTFEIAKHEHVLKCVECGVNVPVKEGG